MGRYSVTEARRDLSSLLDKAIAGEEVIITRRGTPIVELRPIAVHPNSARGDAYARLIAGRDVGPQLGITSVELLNALHDESDASLDEAMARAGAAPGVKTTAV